jgi:hypothetical protein
LPSSNQLKPAVTRKPAQPSSNQLLWTSVFVRKRARLKSRLECPSASRSLTWFQKARWTTRRSLAQLKPAQTSF